MGVKYFFGIDPGTTGAVAVIDQGGAFVEVYDMPGDPGHMADLRKQYLQKYGESPALCVIEKVHSMPGQGVASTFRFGMWYGAVLVFAGSLGCSVEFVTPQKWMKAMLDSAGKTENGTVPPTLARARRLWPEAPLTRKKDHNRADALLLAEYGRRISIGGTK